MNVCMCTTCMQQCKKPTESVGLIVLSLVSVPLQVSHLWQGLYSHGGQEIKNHLYLTPPTPSVNFPTSPWVRNLC